MSQLVKQEALEGNFIARSADGTTLILQRVADGYINATALCKATNKLFADYVRLSGTTAYFSALEADMGIPISELVQVRKGGNPQEQGTWVHPQIAVHLAQWASPEFAVQVSKWVIDWMQGKLVRQPKPSDNPFELIIQQASASIELERRQMVLDQRQTSLEGRQAVTEDRVEAIEAKIEAWGGEAECFTIKGYAKLQNVKLPLSLAKTLGKEATKMCKERCVPTGTARDEVHGIVNTYPEDVLSILFYNHGLLRQPLDA